MTNSSSTHTHTHTHTHTTSNHTALSVSLGREQLGVVDQEHEAGEVDGKLKEHGQYGVGVEDVGQWALLRQSLQGLRG